MRTNRMKTHKSAQQCEKLLYALILTMVFEGILRKLLPGAFSIGLFFVKDFLCIAGVYTLFPKKYVGLEERLSKMWKALFIAFIPLIIYTGSFDVKLSIFGPKQYLLFTVTAFLVPAAFPSYRLKEFKRFIAFLAFLLVPTTLVAIFQHSLPASHWLNQGVGGSNLQAFSAAGYLRVSSTFSFTGQFSWFLNIVCVFLAVRFFLPPDYTNKSLKIVERFMPYVLGSMLIVGAFITGGRTAVLGCAACLLIGFILCAYKSPQWIVGKGVFVVLFLVACFSFISAAKPEFFAVYMARSQGSEEMSHSEEMEGRMLNEFTGWTSWFNNQSLSSMLLGNGLGVMSNGTDQISSYAAEVKSGGFWTETDVASTFWEGGLYLALIWYGFRLSVIVFCTRIWYSLRDTSYSLASSFLLSYVIITGVNGTVGIQPPIAIWWFLCVGAMIVVKNLEITKKAAMQHRRPAMANLNTEENF